jgi:hypothetical protein
MTSTRDSFFEITRPLVTVEATASPLVAGALGRTRSAHDLGGGRGGEITFDDSSGVAEGSVGSGVADCWSASVAAGGDAITDFGVTDVGRIAPR